MYAAAYLVFETLDLPGAYSATGIVTGTPSGAVWFFFFWRITLPACCDCLCIVEKDTKETANPVAKISTGPGYRYHHRLRIRDDGEADVAPCGGISAGPERGATQQPLVQYFAVVTWSLNTIAVVLLFIRKRTILDVWLIVASLCRYPISH